MPEEVTDPVQTNTEPGAEETNEEVVETPEADAKPVAPEKYELTLPEGSLLAPSTIEEIAAYAKERGLSNEAAQEILARESEAVAKYDASRNEQVDAIRAGWIEAGKADKEIGGDNYTKSVELAKRAVEKFSKDTAFKEALKKTSLGDNPDFLKVFARIGKAMADDELVVATTQVPTSKKTMEEIFYSESSSAPKT